MLSFVYLAIYCWTANSPGCYWRLSPSSSSPLFAIWSPTFPLSGSISPSPKFSPKQAFGQKRSNNKSCKSRARVDQSAICHATWLPLCERCRTLKYQIPWPFSKTDPHHLVPKGNVPLKIEAPPSQSMDQHLSLVLGTMWVSTWQWKTEEHCLFYFPEGCMVVIFKVGEAKLWMMITLFIKTSEELKCFKDARLVSTKATTP